MAEPSDSAVGGAAHTLTLHVVVGTCNGSVQFTPCDVSGGLMYPYLVFARLNVITAPHGPLELEGAREGVLWNLLFTK